MNHDMPYAARACGVDGLATEFAREAALAHGGRDVDASEFRVPRRFGIGQALPKQHARRSRDAATSDEKPRTQPIAREQIFKRMRGFTLETHVVAREERAELQKARTSHPRERETIASRRGPQIRLQWFDHGVIFSDNGVGKRKSAPIAARPWISRVWCTATKRCRHPVREARAKSAVGDGTSTCAH